MHRVVPSGDRVPFEVEQSMIRVAIAEDHTLVREALRTLLENSGRCEVVGEASTGEEAVQIVAQRQPDVLLLDSAVPGKDGLEAITDIAEMQVATRVLVVSMHSDDSYAVRAVRAGAAGYVNKTARVNELMAAIDAIVAGQRVVPDGVDAAAKPAASPAQVLSPREFQVLGHLASGLTNREIAKMLEISVKTVDTHRGHVLKKLKLRNNSDLTRFALQHGLLHV
jgi:two-component system, NarL family, invasion response regulator UvrY